MTDINLIFNAKIGFNMGVQITYLMSIYNFDDLTKSNLLRLREQLIRSGNKLVLIDKTGGEKVRLYVKYNLTSVDIDIITIDRSLDLVRGISCVGFQYQKYFESDYIQILAEDDSYVFCYEKISFEEDVALLLTPITFVYDDKVVTEDQTEFNSVVYNSNFFGVKYNKMPKYIGGDSSWHALMRRDVFFEYCHFLKSVDTILWSVSSLPFWFGLMNGGVGVINGFHFTKESRKWSSSHSVENLLKSQYGKVFGNESIYKIDPQLYLFLVLEYVRFKDKGKFFDAEFLLLYLIGGISSLEFVRTDGLRNKFYWFKWRLYCKLLKAVPKFVFFRNRVGFKFFLRNIVDDFILTYKKRLLEEFTELKRGDSLRVFPKRF